MWVSLLIPVCLFLWLLGDVWHIHDHTDHFAIAFLIPYRKGQDEQQKSKRFFQALLGSVFTISIGEVKVL